MTPVAWHQRYESKFAEWLQRPPATITGIPRKSALVADRVNAHCAQDGRCDAKSHARSEHAKTAGLGGRSGGCTRVDNGRTAADRTKGRTRGPKKSNGRNDGRVRDHTRKYVLTRWLLQGCGRPKSVRFMQRHTVLCLCIVTVYV